MKRNAVLAATVAAAMGVSGIALIQNRGASDEHRSTDPREKGVSYATPREEVKNPRLTKLGEGLFSAPAGIAPAIRTEQPGPPSTTVEHLPGQDITRFHYDDPVAKLVWLTTVNAKPVPPQAAEAVREAFTVDNDLTRAFRSRFTDLADPVRVYVGDFREAASCRDFRLPEGATRPDGQCAVVAAVATVGTEGRPIYGAANLLLFRQSGAWGLDAGAVCVADFGPRSCDPGGPT